jgi:methylmalonyl-CoA mutase N-terminal domain/subunit
MRALAEGGIRSRPRKRPRTPEITTDVGIAVDPLYTPAHLDHIGFDYLRDLGFPGEYPFTRGDRAGMNRTDPFVVSAYSGFGDAEACNQRFRKVIEIGAEQILVALDLPTQCGYDSDHEMAAAEVGNVGVAIDTLADMELLFEGIPADSLKRIGTLGNSIGPIVLALYAALGEKQGVPWHRYTVNLQNDPLKEYIARGTQILPPAPAAKLAADAVAWCVEHAPNWSPMTVCVNHINAGGAGFEHGDRRSRSPMPATTSSCCWRRDIRSTRSRRSSTCSRTSGHDFFISIANLRALRRIWARMMKESYGATAPAAMACRTTVYGHGQEALAEPLNNIPRTAFGTLAYCARAAPSYVYLAGYDERCRRRTRIPRACALRTLQIIANEHGFRRHHRSARRLLLRRDADRAGGAADPRRHGAGRAGRRRARVISNGFGRRVMTEGAVRRQRAIDSGERPWVTGEHVAAEAERAEHRVPRRRAGDRAASLRGSRRSRPSRGSDAGAGRRWPRSTAPRPRNRNVVPSVLEAVRAYASVGEIVEIWRRRFGSFVPSTDF